MAIPESNGDYSVGNCATSELNLEMTKKKQLEKKSQIQLNVIFVLSLGFVGSNLLVPRVSLIATGDQVTANF